MNMNINFPHLGIELEHVGRSISILGFHITYYGMLIGLALVAGIFITIYFAVKSRQNIEHYLDLVIGTVLWGVVGARLYYVLFSWDRYQGHFFRIFNLRQGGLAFYGALMAAVLFTVFYAKRKREKPMRLLDTATVGLIVGQIIGRFGNFFNRESLADIQMDFCNAASGRCCADCRYYRKDAGTYRRTGRDFLYSGTSCIFV